MTKGLKLLVFSTLLLSFSACGNVVTSSASTSNNTPSTSEVNSNNSTIIPTNQSTTTNQVTTSQVIEDPRKEAYSYKPHLSEDMPKISVTTSDGSNDFATKYDRNDKLAGKIDYVDCTITTSNCEDEYMMEDVACEIKVRGNYTLNYVKKPLRLKFNKKQKMFGLNDDAKCKSWVLLAEWKDRSMMHNATSFYLGNTILASDGYYSSDYRYVEVELNGEYWGVYLLAEQQQFNEYRMDFTEPEDDYEGTDIGYLLEFDNKYIYEDVSKGGDYTFEVDYNNEAKITKLDGSTYTPSMKGFTIKSDITSQNQVDFIDAYMNNLYNLMYKSVHEKKGYVFNEDYSNIQVDDTLTYKDAIEKVVDVKSLANMYVLSEIACDADVAKSSFYMNVDFSSDKNRKLTFEAPWDYDSSYGIINNICNNAQGAYVANSTNPWLSILINEDWFQDLIKEKWAELIKYEVLSNCLEFNKQASEIYSVQFVEEMSKWTTKKDNHSSTNQKNKFATQLEAYEFNRSWLMKRFNYINTLWGDGEVLFEVE